MATGNEIQSFYQNQLGDIFTGDVMGTLRAEAGMGRKPMIHGRGVRRLTPLECERLQGFPDNWTAGCSDAQRYRQMGNAVAVPVVEWIAKMLVRADLNETQL